MGNAVNLNAVCDIDSIVRVMAENRILGGRLTGYNLYKVTRGNEEHFTVSISDLTGTAFRALKENEPDSIKVFRLISREEVTPCTLDDVVDDIEYESDEIVM